MTAADDGGAVVVVGEVVVRLSCGLDRLLDALASFDRRDADAVLDEIRALRLAGGTIRLLPTEAELASLDAAIAGLADGPIRKGRR